MSLQYLYLLRELPGRRRPHNELFYVVRSQYRHCRPTIKATVSATHLSRDNYSKLNPSNSSGPMGMVEGVRGCRGGGGWQPAQLGSCKWLLSQGSAAEAVMMANAAALKKNLAFC